MIYFVGIIWTLKYYLFAIFIWPYTILFNYDMTPKISGCKWSEIFIFIYYFNFIVNNILPIYYSWRCWSLARRDRYSHRRSMGMGQWKLCLGHICQLGTVSYHNVWHRGARGLFNDRLWLGMEWLSMYECCGVSMWISIIQMYMVYFNSFHFVLNIMLLWILCLLFFPMSSYLSIYSFIMLIKC